MKLFSIMAGLRLRCSARAGDGAQPAKFALCYDLSKAYTFVTPQIAQAARDYAEILNEKGGIEGHPIEIIVQDHGNEPQRGIECYEKLKREGVMVFDMLSTPVSRAVLPRIMADGNILLQSFVGRGDAIDGDVFKWVFPIGPTYWGQVANDIQYIKTKSKRQPEGREGRLHLPRLPVRAGADPDAEDAGRQGRLRPAAVPEPAAGQRPGRGLDADPALQPRLGHQLEPVEHARRRGARDEAQRHPDGQADLGQLAQRGRHQQHRRRSRQGPEARHQRRRRPEPPADPADHSRSCTTRTRAPATARTWTTSTTTPAWRCTRACSKARAWRSSRAAGR